jgi:8-amino-7-oxononanoate synthase
MFPWMEDDLARRRRLGLYRKRRRVQSGQGPHLRLHGRTLVNFSSNDYLGLAGDPRLAEAAAEAARRWGTGAGASPLVSGLLPPLEALEEALAQWEGTEAALVFSSGYTANLALVAALAGREDAVFSDALNHASLIDGCRLSRARVHVYRHVDPGHLEQLLHTEGRAMRRRVIVSDSVFSMDGDQAPLAELLALAERHDALVLLDEAHASGVLGEHGRGLVDDLPAGAPGRDRLIRMGTLSKALGAQGGFVCGTRTLCDWLINTARPYVFSTALAPPAAAAALCAIAIVRQEPERRRRVLALGDRLREGLRRQGLDTGPSSCHLIPILVGDPNRTVLLSQALEEQGLLVPAIRPPSVPEGTSRLRISVTAGHMEADVEHLIEALGPAHTNPKR